MLKNILDVLRIISDIIAYFFGASTKDIVMMNLLIKGGVPVSQAWAITVSQSDYLGVFCCVVIAAIISSFVIGPIIAILALALQFIICAVRHITANIAINQLMSGEHSIVTVKKSEDSIELDK